MEDHCLSVTERELFYSAMMLGLDRLVGVPYDFPAGDKERAAELEETKRALHKRKLLRENSKGEITLDFVLSACAAVCARPDACTPVEAEGLRGTIYAAAGSFLFLESEEDGGFVARWFEDAQSVDAYMERAKFLKL